ncbi:MAG: dihydrofolate reductase [Methylotenera sp.]|nr:dihydrofolate reductase [Methylotenera sp.]
MKQNLSLIVAVAKNGVIGKDNTLPWHLPEDLKRFRALTTGHHIIMGRKTYESLGRLLPGRTTVIVTRNKDYKIAGALIAHTVIEAAALCKGDAEAFIIGGAELYKDALKLVNKLYITQIDIKIDGDAFFPEFNNAEWQETLHEEHTSAQGLKFSYLTLEQTHL